MACVEGVGRPLVIQDALQDWRRGLHGELLPSTAELARRFAGSLVVVNDRAPARHADCARGRPQHSFSVQLAEYALYIKQATPALEAAPPLYLNGWRARQAHPELAREWPLPHCFNLVDHTDMILHQLSQQLFGSGGGGGGGGGSSDASAWWRGISDALWKLFIGPPLTVTRLHVDAADAHGWLAQTEGHKLFALFPPCAGEMLAPMTSEPETLQSDFDPLSFAVGPSPPDMLLLAPLLHVAVVQPGEAILVPRGWWHYALSLTPSCTAQCNFYEARSNAAALVKFVVARLPGKFKAAAGAAV